MPSKRKSKRATSGTASTPVRRRPHEYDHEYGLRGTGAAKTKTKKPGKKR